ncbi:MAG: gliding motility protein GldM, partial [Cytophagaceae bacterium]
EMIKRTGGYNDDGNLKGAKDETEIEVMMIGSKKQGKGYELQRKLNEYISFVNKETGRDLPLLALDAREDAIFKNKPDQRNKDFSEVNFGQTPLVAALAVVSEMESRVASIESSILTDIHSSIGMEDFKFDKLNPMVRSNSKYVPAGMTYEADLFMTATSTSLKPEMYLGDNSLAVDENGIGKVSFTASGGGYDENGMAKKVWTGKIKMKTPLGEDTVYTVTEEYIVTKPVIEVRSGTVQSLYRNCGNKLNIQVPALGNSYNPQFTVNGASLIKGSRKGEVTVIPTAANVTLKVSSNGFTIGEEKFKVQLIPLPQLEVLVNNNKIDPIKGVNSRDFRSLRVRAIADKSFQDALPDDAIYSITDWNVTLARSKRGIKNKPFNSQNGDISEIVREAQPGDLIIVEIKTVKRRNFRNEWEVVPIESKTEIIPIF